MKSASSPKAVPGQPSAEHAEADVQHIVRGMVRRGLQPLASKAAIGYLVALASTPSSRSRYAA